MLIYGIRDVFMATAVDLNKIAGSVCIYLLVAIVWAILYEFLELWTPGSFSGLTASPGAPRFDEFLYFSLVTITTLGYGDTTPATPLAGTLAALEAVIGVFYTTVLVASLVGDFLARSGRR